MTHYIFTDDEAAAMNDACAAMYPGEVIVHRNLKYGVNIHNSGVPWSEMGGPWGAGIDLDAIASDSGIGESMESVLAGRQSLEGRRCVLWDYVDQRGRSFDTFMPPTWVTFTSSTMVRLHKVPTIVKGELVAMDHYDPDELDEDGVYSKLVLREEWRYTYTEDGVILLFRDHEVKWVMEGGGFHRESKIRRKPYAIDPSPAKQKDAISAGKRRRQNIIDQLEIEVLGSLVEHQYPSPYVEGLRFFERFSSELDLYVKINANRLHGAIRDEAIESGDEGDFRWLNLRWSDRLTIGDYLMNSINIWGMPLSESA